MKTENRKQVSKSWSNSQASSAVNNVATGTRIADFIRYMKRSFLVIAGATLYLSFVPTQLSFANDPGGNEGGGDHETSSPAMVGESTGQSAFDLVLFLNYQTQHRRSTPNYEASKPLSNRHIQEMIDTIYDKFDFHWENSTGYFLIKNDDKLYSSIVVKKACPVDPLNKELKSGSTGIGKVFAPICISTDQMGQIPKESLQQQMIALIGHEVAHQAGYGEEDAKLFQNYLSNHFARSEGKSTLYATLDWIRDSLAKIRVLQKGSNKEALCTEVGVAAGYIMAATRLGFVLQPSGSQDLTNTFETDQEARMLSSYLERRELRTFCGAEPLDVLQPAEPVCQDDAADLSETLNDISNVVEVMNSLMNEDASAIPASQSIRSKHDERYKQWLKNRPRCRASATSQAKALYELRKAEEYRKHWTGTNLEDASATLAK